MLGLGFAISAVGSLLSGAFVAKFGRTAALWLTVAIQLPCLFALSLLSAGPAWLIYAAATIVYQIFWSFVVPVMMAVSIIKILNRFAWFAMYAKDEGVSLGPRQFYVEVGKMVIPINTNGVEVTTSLDGYKGVREQARDITRTPHLHGELDVDCFKQAVNLALENQQPTREPLI